jgi:intermediate peptidase
MKKSVNFVLIHCGKRRHPSDSDFESSLGFNTPAQDSQQNNFQLPVVTLTASLTEVSASVATNSLLDSTLTFADVETLWHECGHAVHSLLSRTEFQHLHGTRGALDFVEVPSHVFEYWCRDYRVVEATPL